MVNGLKKCKSTAALVSVFVFILSVALFCRGVNGVYAQGISYNEAILYGAIPRAEGSVEEQNTIAVITDELDQLKIEYQIDDFSHYTEKFSKSKNIYAYIPGAGATNKTIVVAVALNRSSGYSISLLLSMLEQYRVSPVEINLIFAFLGADYRQEEYIGIGSQLLSESLSALDIDLLLYLNLDRSPEILEVGVGTTGRVTQLDKLELFIQIAGELGQQIDIPAFWRTTYGGRNVRSDGGRNVRSDGGGGVRSDGGRGVSADAGGADEGAGAGADESTGARGAADTGADVSADAGAAATNASHPATPTDFFLGEGIQALTLSVKDPHTGWGGVYRTTNVIERFILLFPSVESTSDNNYLLFPLGKTFYIINERSLIYTLIILIALILCVGYYSKGNLIKQYAPLLKQHLFLFCLSIAACFCAIYTSQFGIEFMFSLFPVANLWQYASFLAVTLKLSVSIALYFAFEAIINRAKVATVATAAKTAATAAATPKTAATNTAAATPKTAAASKTYGAFALALGAASQFAALANVLLTIVTAWLFLGTVCFIVAKKAKYKSIIFHIALIVPICCLTAYLISAPAGLHRTIIFSNIIHSASATIIVLPYFFMYRQLCLLDAKVVMKNGAAYAIVATHAAIVIAFFALYDPFITSVTNDIRVIEVIDQERQNHTIRYKNNIDKDTDTSIQIQTPEQYSLSTPRIHEGILELSYNPVYEITHRTDVSDGYNYHLLKINGEAGVQEIDLTITSEQPLVILEADTPYVNTAENTIEFYTGGSPSVPLEIGFFVPDSTIYPLTVEVTATPNELFADVTVQLHKNIEVERPYALHANSKVMLRYTIEHDKS